MMSASRGSKARRFQRIWAQFALLKEVYRRLRSICRKWELIYIYPDGFT